MIPLRRMRRHLALFAAVGVITALLGGLAFGLVGLLADQADAGVRAGLAQRAGGDLAFGAALPLADDVERQDEQVRAAVRRSFAATGVPIDVTRQADARVTLRLPGESEEVERPAVALGDDALDGQAELVSGSFATTDDEVAVQVASAEQLGLAVGDELTLDGRSFTVSGTWTVLDPLDPRWYGGAIASDGDGAASGPFAVDPSLLSGFGGTPRARWVLAPRVDRVEAADLRPLVDAWLTIGGDWRGSVDDIGELQRQSRFVQTAGELGAQVDGLRAAQPATLLLLAAVGAVALVELARQLAAARSWETRLRWSRGASSASLVTGAAIEVGAVALLGAATGSAAALALRGGAPVDPAVPLVVVVAMVLVAAGSAAVAQRRELRRIIPDPRRLPLQRAAAPTALVLAVGAAALSVWQLRLYGSAVTVDAEGLTGVDPVAVPAPALALVAVVLLGLVALPSAVAVVARRPVGSLGVRLVVLAIARRMVPVGAAFAVVALAAGTVLVAGAYGATWASAYDRASVLRAGADLRVSTISPGLGPTALGALRGADAVAGMAPAHTESLTVGSDEGVIVAIDPDALARLSRVPDFDADAAAAGIALEQTVAALPADATAVSTTARLTGFALDPVVGFWISDGDGVLTPVPATAEPVPAAGDGSRSVRYSAELPAGVDRRVAAIDLAFPEDAVTTDDASSTVRLEPLLAGGSEPGESIDDDVFWLVDSADIRATPAFTDGSGRGLTVAVDTRIARMTPSLGDGSRDSAELGVVVSQTLADLLSLHEGGVLSFALDNGIDRLTCVVRGVVPAIPGTGVDAALLIDLALVQHFQLRVAETPPAPSTAWVDTDEPDAAIAEARALLPANTRFDLADDRAGRQVLGAGALVLWIGAIGCLVLAAAGVAAAAGSELRIRRGDLGVLRALGLSGAEQAAIRAGELALITVAGLLTGLVAGALVALLTVPQLAVAAVPLRPAAVAVVLAVDWPAVLLALAALLVAVAAVVAWTALRVRAVARSATPEAAS